MSPAARERAKPRVIVMLKEPRPGRVKTRLGRDIGMVSAAWWFRHQSAALLRRLQDPRWTLTLAISPDLAAYNSRIWPVFLPRIPQGKGHLGRRMIAAMRHFSGPTVVIGADIPGITRTHIASAFSNLGQNDVVFGPAEDGGYWLIGVRHGRLLAPSALDGVRWSSAYARADSQNALRSYRMTEITTLRDVDELRDLDELR